MMLRNRRLGGLVAVGYLLGYLLVFVHFVAEQHAECAEHGVSHHVSVDSDEPGSHAALETAPSLDELPGLIDDHCHLLNAVREQVSTPASAAVVFVLHLPVEHVSPAGGTRPSRAYGAVWRYAPKQSPPLSA